MSSMRSMTYGIQPICASAYNNLRSGWRTNTPENKKSIIDIALLVKMPVAVTPSGASGLVVIVLVPDPMCMQGTVLVSAHAAQNGSQYPEWIEGRSIHAGHSLNATARTPRAALR